MTVRVAFLGTPDFAVPALRAIAASGHSVVVVYSRPPAAKGRGLQARPSPVHALADELGLPVETPRALRDDDAVATLRGYGPDVAVVVAYGLLLPQAILDIPAHGCLNLHASLLPRWRGAAPIQRAVMAGDRQTGISVMRMEVGLDTGPTALEQRVAIEPDATTGELHDRLAALGSTIIVRALDALESGTLAFEPQADAGTTYARKIANDEARIDWTRPAAAIHDQVRGLSPVPGAFLEADFGRGRERVKVLRTAPVRGAGGPGTLIDGDGTIACGDGALRLVEVQRSGKAPMPAADFWRGARLPVGGDPRVAMPRYKLLVEYDGTPFVGWQSQANGPSVQDAVEQAIRLFSGESVRIQCAGRTDTGVHATGQVAHVDLARTWPTNTVRDAINAHLGSRPISVLSAEAVPDGFNARTSAVKRHYVYRILNRRAPPALDRFRAWHVPRALDTPTMNEAASLLLGHHDFTTFRSSDCQANSPMRTLDVFSVTRDGEEIRVAASARSFLHHQVRSMVGTVVLAGRGRWSVADVGLALAARSRGACGPLAPPCGLTFVGVDYPDPASTLSPD